MFSKRPGWYDCDVSNQLSTLPRSAPATRAIPWMSDERFREAWLGGMTLEEIRSLNKRLFGVAPSRTGVSYHAETLDLPSRGTQGSRSDLVPWRVKMPHASSRWRHMLESLSRYRQNGDDQTRACAACRGKSYPAGEPVGISDKDRRAVALLHNHLHGRGAHMVVSYNEHVGFHLIDANPDDDIIRRPGTVTHHAARKRRASNVTNITAGRRGPAQAR
jgi:hypothetical protein